MSARAALRDAEAEAGAAPARLDDAAAVGSSPDARARASDVTLALTLFAIDPSGLGGVMVRSAADPVRDRVVGWLAPLLARGAPVVTVPLGVTEDRLLGGLALAETLQSGKVVRERGLLARAHGGVVVARMAERLESHVAAHLCAALDRGVLAVERDGGSAVVPARFGVLALDEGDDGGDEAVARGLVDRLAFRVDLTALGRAHRDLVDPDVAGVVAARARVHGVLVSAAVTEAVVTAAAAFGVDSVRGSLLCLAAARAHAALHGRAEVAEADAAAAVRLVLGFRATRLPAPPAEDSVPDSAPEPAPPPPDAPDLNTLPTDEAKPADETPPADVDRPAPDASGDVLVEAIQSGIPPGLLALLAAPRPTSRRLGDKGGRAGVERLAPRGGRPAGVRAGAPRHGERLHVLETVRAAAPWQALRRREANAAVHAARGQPFAPSAPERRVLVRADDFRVARTKRRSETCVIFCVDASGSAALQRLAEVKGAIEQVLLDCYSRRDHVALIAFRGDGAQLVLPPLRSLVRVRRGLAGLVGGGVTPLAAGIDAALTLAKDVTKRGQTPVIVLMTDGRANVAKDGSRGAGPATASALECARSVRVAGVRALFLDTAPRPREPARQLAAAMEARYLPLPYLDAAGISRQVQSLVAAP